MSFYQMYLAIKETMQRDAFFCVQVYIYAFVFLTTIILGSFLLWEWMYMKKRYKASGSLWPLMLWIPENRTPHQHSITYTAIQIIHLAAAIAIVNQIVSFFYLWLS